MKFRLSKRILAAVMAAVASVSFSSAGTATLGAAAFGFTVQQAAAEEAASTTVAPAEGTEFTAEEDELVVDLNEENKEKEESKEEEQKVKYEPKTKRILPCTMTQDEAELFAKNFGGGQGTLEDLHWSADVANDSGDTAAMIPAAESAAQATATGTTALPSTDLGFTTDAYGRSAAEVAKGSAPEFETPKPAFAATGGALNLSTPTTGSSNASSSVATPAPTAVPNHLDNGYGYYQYGTPILRQATITTPPAMLGETAPAPSEYIFSFNNGETTEYFSEVQDFYNLEVKSGDTGTIQFSSAMRGKPLTVEGDFIMTGEKFTIDTNGVQVTFAQAMSNYDTAFTVKDSSGGGKITALAPAAFQSLYVESGEMEIKTQIGVVDQLKVGGAGATLTVDETAKVILTQQVEYHGGTINLNGTVDASNLPNSVATKDVHISFVNQDGDTATSGFLAPGEWNLGKEGSTGTIKIGDKAKLVVALSDFKIINDLENPMPRVKLDEVDKRLWFQNGGTLESAADIFGKEGGNAQVLLTHTESSPTAEVNVDLQIRDECVMYVAQGTEAQIHLVYDEYGDPQGALGQLYLMSGSTTEITPVFGWLSQINTITFVGEDVKLKHNNDLADWGEMREITSNSLTVETATTASVFADIMPHYGYYQGEGDILYRAGSYTLKGQLTMEEGYTFDLRHRNDRPSWEPVVKYDAGKNESTLYFEETLAHLTMGDEGKLVLKNGASFKASTVTNDDSNLTEEGNLDTRRIRTVTGQANPKDYDPKAYPDEAWTAEMEAALPQVNGTMVIEGGATLTALNEKAPKGVDNYYTTRNKYFMISGGTVRVTDERDESGSPAENLSDTTVSNQLDLSNVVNDKADSHGSLTLDNANEKTLELGTVYAKEGDIYVTNKDKVTAFKVQIGEKLEVAAVKDANFSEQAANATLTVKNMLQAEGGSTQDGVGSASKVKADVVLIEGATLDVSKAGGVGGLDLTGTLTINKGAMLSEGDLAQIFQMEIGAMYDLAFDVTMFNNSTGAITWESDNRIDASLLFGDEQFWEGEYYVCYSGNGVKGGNGNNVGTVYLYKAVPEPTTGTLSLLALCALAARRRRK